MTLEQRLKEMETHVSRFKTEYFEKGFVIQTCHDLELAIKALRLAIEQRDYYYSFIEGRITDDDDRAILKILTNEGE